ncbi:MAG: hypothetical protein DRN04_08780 [Thermoprotei archaeon]|nr:MAG: hypothetical protein DRN04_08780 [Thermoprotei archaeon]
MGIPEGSVFLDITNKFYQEFLLKKIAALKKAGVKYVCLDALFTQANIAYRITRDYNHPAVKEAYMAAVSLVKKIKAMGIMVGTWSDRAVYSYKEVLPVNFVTKTVEVNEVLSLQINISKWREVVKLVKGKVNATILMIFDFSPLDNTPLAVFSQKLSPEQQKNSLKQCTTHAYS